MRKTKKLIALVLAMVLIVAFMAMNVSAAAVEPRANCSGCGAPISSSSTSTRTKEVLQYTYRADTCPNNIATHNHAVIDIYSVRYCRTCGTTVSSTYVRTEDRCTG